ncbi:hypothetical protein DPMN_053427 [Dreissena polymorpha]|uniref:Uncharacterized protein n=1 Tax=Dreissena polymorpha TaxID=45954 RepID=A0A9D4CLB4_DREPO|nr:hypothetical protein DPMN_053427 [Dreissena polymorpha]
MATDIIRTNVLTKFQKDWTKLKNTPPPCGHIFRRTITICELTRAFITINKNAPPPTRTIFLFIQDIIRCLTKFNEDRTIHVASRVLTMKMLTMHDGRRINGDHKITT